MEQLASLKEDLRTCPSEDYVRVAGNVSRVVADLPPADSAAVREWVETLYEGMKSGEERLDLVAPFVQGLAARSDPESVPLLGQIMLDESMGMTEDIAEWLGDMGTIARDAVPFLQQLLGSEAEPWARAKAATSLGSIGDPSSDELLVSVLKDSEGSVRLAALDSLVSLRAAIPFDQLAALARADTDYLVRAAAIRALRKLYPEQASSVLRSMAERETNPTVLKALSEQ